MENYRIVVKKSAADELGRIPKKDLSKIVKRVASLAGNPRPRGCEKLSVLERYRIRQGDYRIVYSIDDEGRFVEIFKIGHRSEVYKTRK